MRQIVKFDHKLSNLTKIVKFDDKVMKLDSKLWNLTPNYEIWLQIIKFDHKLWNLTKIVKFDNKVMKFDYTIWNLLKVRPNFSNNLPFHKAAKPSSVYMRFPAS